MHWSGLNSDLKHFLKHTYIQRRGANLSKIEPTNKYFEKWSKIAIKFDRKCKIAKHRCHQQTYYKLRNRGGQFRIS